MNRIVYLFLLLLTTLAGCTKQTSPDLRSGFLDPPVEARPRGLWCWVNGNFDKGEITHELEEAKDKGMGGMDIWDVYSVVDEMNVVPDGPQFMSDEYLDAICYAINEATRLGLDMGLVVASGWNAGGHWTKPENATMALYRSVVPVTGPGSFRDTIPFPELPHDAVAQAGRVMSIIPRGTDGLPLYYKEIAVLAWPATTDSLVPSPGDVVDLSAKMDKSGCLSWDVPEGRWNIVRYVCTNSGQPMYASPINSIGPMIDHFSQEATRVHINFFIEKLLSCLGTFKGKALKYLYTDSYEVKGQLWTPLMLDEFRQRMGYDMLPYLPVLNGYVIENKDITQRFLYDYARILSDLIIENHYIQASRICNEHGIGFAAEAAGPGWPIHNCPFESLRSSGSLDIPRGEFWHSHPTVDMLQVIKGVASAAHIYDQKYVEAESFTTAMLWQESPDFLKPYADRAFCEGLNRIVFHTFPHTPPEAGIPGWIYSFGTQVSENQTWWPKARAFNDYLARVSYMLQQGNFVGDVLYFYGDSAPNFVPARHIDPSLGFGYDYDVTNSDILINRLEVKNSKLVLPNGQSYEVLVLPENDRMPLEVLQKIRKLVADGAFVIGPRPVRTHGLFDYEKKEQELNQLAAELWQDIDGSSVREHTFGAGKIVTGKTIRQVLEEKGTGPDFSYIGKPNPEELDFIHRRTDREDIYFIWNRQKEQVHIQATFRVKGKRAEIWDPVSGQIHERVLYKETGQGTTVPLSMEPNGSLFIVFTSKPATSRFDDDVEYSGKNPREAVIFGPGYSTCHDTDFVILEVEGSYAFTRAGNVVSEYEVKNLPPDMEITGPWIVRFQEGREAPAKTVMDELMNWADSKEEGIRYFSGIAAYEKEIEVSEEWLHEDAVIELDLGRVEVLAEVFVNGQSAGTLWTAPFKADITRLLKPGTNSLRIEVANLWPNRLIGDSKLPEDQRVTKTSVIRLPNAWFHLMKDLPNEDYGLLDSGLFGPVKLVFGKKVMI